MLDVYLQIQTMKMFFILEKIRKILYVNFYIEINGSDEETGGYWLPSTIYFCEIEIK